MNNSIKDSEFNALVKLLDDNDWEVFNHVQQKLISFGEPSIPMLENAWMQADNETLQQRLETVIQSIQFSNIKDRFITWIDNGCVDLLEPSILVAKCFYPDIDENIIIEKLNRLNKSIWLELNASLSALEEVQVINNVIFRLNAYFGEQVNTPNPDPNLGFINKLLETKKGNSISLSILYLILAQKNDLPIYGVYLPFHFIMAYTKRNLSVEELNQKDQDKSVMFYLNPLNKGIAFSRIEITNYLKQIKLEKEQSYYSPCHNSQVIKALLYNQIACFQQSKNQVMIEKLESLLNLLDKDLPTQF
ncbi:MAG: hypothetical protein H6553_09750 [Chitinophagales bacterium]|nr:hypothetical protein [Chitinophagales bacterium]